MIGVGLALSPMAQARPDRRSLARTTRILWVGSSSEAARWCGTGPRGMDGARDKGYTMIAGQRLAARGVPVNTQGYFGEQNNDRSIDALIGYDRRLHDLHGLTVNAAYSQMGGYPLRFAIGQEAEYAIDFDQAADTIVFYVSTPKVEAEPGSIDYAIDGETATTFTFPDDKVQRVVVSGLAGGLHRLRLSTAAGMNHANVNFHGAEAYLSSATEIRFMPVGARAWNTSERFWTRTGGYSPIGMLSDIKPDIVIATFGGNDDDDDSVHRGCEIWGDAVVAAGAKPVFVGKPYRKQSYYDAMAALAEKYGTPTHEMGVISEEKAIREGEKAKDNLHFLAPWHRREGEALGDWLYETALPELGVLR